MAGGEQGGVPAHGLPRMVAAYVRVSTRGQDYEYQRTAIERAALARGERIQRWYADVASGRSMDRPQLRLMQAHCRRQLVKRLWVWRLDRLTRSGIADTLNAVGELRRLDVEVVSVADGFALDGPAADLVLAVLAWAAQIEREKIRENQMAARLRMRLEGREWGRPRVETAIRESVIDLHRREFSQREIARELQVSKTFVWTVLHSIGQTSAAENMRRP